LAQLPRDISATQAQKIACDPVDLPPVNCLGTLSRLLLESSFVPGDRENAHVEILGSDWHFAR
jgi:hypothetical protein